MSEDQILASLDNIQTVLIRIQNDLNDLKRANQAGQQEYMTYQNRLRKLQRQVYVMPGATVLLAMASIVMQWWGG